MEQVKQTSVEWLFEQLKLSSKKTDNINNEHLFFYRMFEQAKAMEKEQIMESYKDSTCQFSVDSRIDYPKSAEQYYKETYGK